MNGLSTALDEICLIQQGAVNGLLDRIERIPSGAAPNPFNPFLKSVDRLCIPVGQRPLMYGSQLGERLLPSDQASQVVPHGARVGVIRAQGFLEDA